MRVELLGGAAAVLDDGRVVELRPTMRDQALAYLAWSGDWVGRDRLGFLFWPDVPDATVRHNVRQLLKRIRHLEWLDGFEVAGDRVRWHVETDASDLLRGDSTHWDEAPKGGELLPGFERNATVEFEEWLLAERRRIGAVQRSARLAAATAAAGEGAPDRALGLLASMLTEDDDGMLLVRYLEVAVDAGRRDEAIVAFDEVSRRLRDELGVEPPRRAVELAEQARNGIGQSPPPRRRIVGRRHELVEIAELLERPACRLLTLLGPGGIGKSALARELLEGSSPGRWQRSAFVALESVSDPDLIPTRIAADCGIPLDARLDPLDQIVDALHGYRSLLAVDNAEHLPAGWHVLSALAERCPDLTLVVTSRVRLRLTDEWIYEVGGLVADEAVELLVDRAGRLAPGLAVGPDEALALCHHVGSSPLGIELAVPWLRVMSLAAVIDMVTADVSAMSARAADTPARHHSVEAAMAHSWTLAEPVERAAVEALSVFAAPYTLQLATAVADVPPLTVRDLVDMSLVHRRSDGLLMSHPLVRQYAAARLAADDARRTEVRERHARAVLDSLGSDDTSRSESLADDAIAAWQWAIEHDAVDLLDRSAAAFARLLDRSARHEQGLRMLTAARASIVGAYGDDAPVPAALDHGAAVLLERLGRHADAAVLAQRAATTAAAVNDQRHLILALVTLGWARKWTDGDPAQHATTRAALPIAEQLGDDQLTVHVLNGLGCSAPTLQECRDHLLAGLRLARHNDLQITSAMLLNNLGMVVWALGDAIAARDRIAEALELARANTDPDWTAATLLNLAFVHAQDGELTTARALIDEAEQLVTDNGQLDPRVLGLVISGEIHRATGDYSAAHERAREALRLARAVDNRAYVLRALRLHGLLLLDLGHDEPALHTLAAVLPHTDRRGDFTSEIINPRIWNDLTIRFDDDEFERAVEWAQHRSLEDVADHIAGLAPHANDRR